TYTLALHDALPISSVVCNVASSTTGVLPAAMFTASANERRSGTLAPGACATRGAGLSATSRASSRLLLLRDTMEIEVDVSVEVRSDVEPFRHAGRECAAHH